LGHYDHGIIKVIKNAAKDNIEVTKALIDIVHKHHMYEVKDAEKYKKLLHEYLHKMQFGSKLKQGVQNYVYKKGFYRYNLIKNRLSKALSEINKNNK
jgi:hypothetical protein